MCLLIKLLGSLTSHMRTPMGEKYFARTLCSYRAAQRGLGLELEPGAGTWDLRLEPGSGTGTWDWDLGLELGPGTWDLGLGPGTGTWDWDLGLGLGPGLGPGT